MNTTTTKTKCSGKGTITFDNGDVYEGAFQDNEPDGVGKMTYKNGRVCEGIWKKGKIQYEGELNENGNPHGNGRGKWIYSDGTYEGEWKNGLRDGKGTFKWTDGSSYEGEWKGDNRHGQGTFKCDYGSSYEGEWKDNNENGKGTFKEADGSVTYYGEYKDGMHHGNGTYNYPNGAVYAGEWRADKMHGRGVKTYANRDIYDGQWKDNCKDGQGTMKFHYGDVYEGEFSKNMMHGKGTYTYAAGVLSKSIGEWKEGKKCGLFKNIIIRVGVEISRQVHYDNDELFDTDTDTEDAAPAIGAAVAMLAFPLLKSFLGFKKLGL